MVAPSDSARAAVASRSATVNVTCHWGGRISVGGDTQPIASAKPGGTPTPD
jgi:hypothetical protein